MGTVHKYRSVLGDLQRDITAGRYPAGSKLPSESVLIQRFRVSRITVRRALAELERIGLIDRVAGSGSFVRSMARAGLVFGLVIPNLGETEIFEPICQAIAASPDAQGTVLMWGHADPREPREEQALALAGQWIERRVDGVFFAPLELSPHSAEINRRVMEKLRAEKIPVVLLDRRPQEGPRCDLAGIDNHRAGSIATTHLRKLGAARIGFLGYLDQASTVQLRINGYRDALEGAAGARIFLVPAEEQMRISDEAMDCDAFVCANDRVAARLMHALLARGVRIPQDVRIVGMDDVAYASLLPVPLTTVHQHCREIGEAALRLMLDRLARPNMAAREVLVDCELVVRESCGGRS